MDGIDTTAYITEKIKLEYGDRLQKLGEDIGKSILDTGLWEDVHEAFETRVALRLVLIPVKVILELAVLDAVDPNYYTGGSDEKFV